MPAPPAPHLGGGGASGCAAHSPPRHAGEAADADARLLSPTGAPAGASPAWWGAGRGIRRGRTPGPGVEETGRQSGNEFLRRTAAELAGPYRHRPQRRRQSETPLPTWLRGAASHGLAGIRPRRGRSSARCSPRRGRLSRPIWRPARSPMWRTPPTPTSTTPATASAARWGRCHASQPPPHRERGGEYGLPARRQRLSERPGRGGPAERPGGRRTTRIEARHTPSSRRPSLPGGAPPAGDDGDGSTNCPAAHLKAVVELARGRPSAVVFLPPAGGWPSGAYRSCCHHPV